MGAAFIAEKKIISSSEFEKNLSPPLKISQGLVIGADRLSSLLISIPAAKLTGAGLQQSYELRCT